jgi:hypothetical protein
MVAMRRALLMVWCAQELADDTCPANSRTIHLDLSVKEFQQALESRYARAHPELVRRSESTIERARLDRPAGMESIPRVILRQGAPRRTG